MRMDRNVYLPDESNRPTATRVGRNVQRARDMRSLTTAQLSDRLDCIGWPLDIDAIERGGKAVQVDDVVALALVLGVTPNDLMFENPDPEFIHSDRLLTMPGSVKGMKWGAPARDLHCWAGHGERLTERWDLPVPLTSWCLHALADESESDDVLATGQPEKMAPFAALLLMADKLLHYWCEDIEATDPPPDDADTTTASARAGGTDGHGRA